jgi:hypothetical protein
MEISESVETSDGMDMLERVKEEKLQIVTDMTAREVAEGRLRKGRGSSESYSIVDAISNIQNNSLSSLTTLGAQQESRIKLETQRMEKEEERKNGEVSYVFPLIEILFTRLTLHCYVLQMNTNERFR